MLSPSALLSLRFAGFPSTDGNNVVLLTWGAPLTRGTYLPRKPRCRRNRRCSVPVLRAWPCVDLTSGLGRVRFEMSSDRKGREIKWDSPPFDPQTVSSQMELGIRRYRQRALKRARCDL